ncbi:MAG TPA: SRPBCC family protein [Candidatus Acidoferrum sp.]
MKWMLWIFIALAGVLMLITLIGWLLPKAHSVSREAQFPVPREAIWKAITDVEAMPVWRQGLKSVKLLPDKNGLPSWVETSASGTIPFETVVSQPPSKLVVRIADPRLPFGGTWTYEVTPVAAGSSLRIREDGEVYNPVFRFLSRFVFGYSGTIDAYLKSLERKLAEQPEAGN